MLSLNVLGPASNGVAVLIDMRQIAARLLRCLGWGARHGSTRLPSSMETARMRLVEGSVLTTTWPARQTSERTPSDGHTCAGEKEGRETPWDKGAKKRAIAGARSVDLQAGLWCPHKS